ncbi:hypothetical protein JCGZ_15568 [Jatropha curcas]|uniref:Uncharacterized protein n=1 Tax=Jatropha curcas TaxID=180498 RepID=A0A067K3U0_JATCU|nr:hypothetical protein JCGZ_15568 [Jatropha curcas]
MASGPAGLFAVRENRLFEPQNLIWAYEYCIYPGGPSGDTPADSRRIPRYLAHCHHTFSSSEDPHYWRCFLNDKALSDEGEAWRTYPARGVASYILERDSCCGGTGLTGTSWGGGATGSKGPWRRVPHAPPRHMCLLEGMTREDLEEEYEGSPADVPLSAGDYATYFSTRLHARLPEVREYTQERKKHRTVAYYRVEAEGEAETEAAAPAGRAGAVLGDVPFPPGIEVALDPALGLGSAIIIPADLRQAPPPLCLLRGTRSYAVGLGSPGLTLPGSILSDLEIGRLQRHQSRQSSAITQLQLEVDRLRTRLEVEGIPLDFSEEDDDGFSSDDALPSPPPQAAAGPSQRRR